MVFQQAYRKLLGRLGLRNGKAAPTSLVIPVDWNALLGPHWAEWEQAVAQARGGPRVLIATSHGGHPGVTPIETLLGVALTLRGAEVHFLLCDAFLPACMEATWKKPERHAEFVREGPQAFLCGRCWAEAQAMFAPLGLPIHRYSTLVGPDDHREAQALVDSLSTEAMASFRLEGLAVGEHALAGALRYFARGDLRDEPDAEAIWRRYFRAALLTVRAAQRLFDRYGFAAACFNHGIYVPQGLIGEVARQRQVRVINWNTAYRKRCFIFSHGDTYHHTLMTEPVSAWEDMPWTPDMERAIMDYLVSRWYGTHDWVWFHEHPQHDLEAIVAGLGLDLNKPLIGLLTNVMWDAQLHYPANAFPNMLDWVLRTIAYFATRPDLQLVIRVHPAEIRGTVPSRQKIADEIARAYPTLPPNIFLIPPESPISTSAIMLQCDAVLIYGTKTGVELTSFGIPVIVAGEAWIRNKGVTLDARSAEEYFALLDRLPLGRRLDEATVQRARKYAYHFFFRRMIPISVMEPLEGWPPFTVRFDSLVPLRPGGDPGLDVICRGILEGTPFIYPAERFMAVEVAPAAVASVV
jgi:hypothetical protein